MVADTPGHEQYTRNMATGASNARARDHPDRCAQGRPGADPAALVHLLAARHPPRGRGGEQDRSGRLPTRRFRSHCGRLSRRLLRHLASRRSCRSRSPHVTATTSSTPVRAIRLGIAALPCSDYLETHRYPVRDERHAVPFSGAMGQPAEPRFPRLCRNGRFRQHCGWRRDHRGGFGPELAGSSEILTYDGDLASAEAGDAVTLTLADEIDIGRGDILARPT